MPGKSSERVNTQNSRTDNFQSAGTYTKNTKGSIYDTKNTRLSGYNNNSQN